METEAGQYIITPQSGVPFITCRSYMYIYIYSVHTTEKTQEGNRIVQVHYAMDWNAGFLLTL